MSLKDIVEAAKELISTFVSNIFSTVKKFFWWLYNKEWTAGELVVVIVFIVVVVATVYIGNFLEVAREIKKEQGKQDKLQKDKRDKKPSVLSEISKTEEDIHSKKS